MTLENDIEWVCLGCLDNTEPNIKDLKKFCFLYTTACKCCHQITEVPKIIRNNPRLAMAFCPDPRNYVCKYCEALGCQSTCKMNV